METASSISRRRPHTEENPYLGQRSVFSDAEAPSGYGPDTVRGILGRLRAPAYSAADCSRSVARRKRFSSNLRRRLSITDEATAAAAADAETVATVAAVAGGDLASWQQISAIGK